MKQIIDIPEPFDTADDIINYIKDKDLNTMDLRVANSVPQVVFSALTFKNYGKSEEYIRLWLKHAPERDWEKRCPE